MVTAIDQSNLRLDLTTAEAIVLLRALNLPPIPGIGARLTGAEANAQSTGGALLNAITSLQVRGLARSDGDAITIDPAVVGILGACANASRFLRIVSVAPPTIRVFHVFFGERLTVLHEQPFPYASRMRASHQTREIEGHLSTLLDIGTLPALPLASRTEYSLELATANVLRTAVREGRAEALLRSAGWDSESARAVAAAVRGVRTYITCTAFGNVAPQPPTLGTVEILITDHGLMYIHGSDPLRIGGIDGAHVGAALLGLGRPA